MKYIGMAVLVVAIVVAMNLASKGFEAQAFCHAQGHDAGRYKAFDGGFYSCADFTRYDAETKLLKVKTK